MKTRLAAPILPQHIEDYRRDGVVCLRQMIDPAWIRTLQRGVADVVADPQAWGIEGPSHGPMVSVAYLWRSPGPFREFALGSPVGEIIGRVLGANMIQMYHDHLFHKPPLSPKVMQWHPDHLWPFRGRMIPNMWIALSRVTEENGRIQFIAGYHRYCIANDIRYGPAGHGEAFPNFEVEVQKPDFGFRVLAWDLEPGDAVLFHLDTPHYSTGNNSATDPRTGLAVRVLGDDATWCTRPGLAPVPGVDFSKVVEGERPEPSELFPVIWRRELAVSQVAQ